MKRTAKEHNYQDYFICDHTFTSCVVSFVKSVQTRKTIHYRKLKSIDHNLFSHDLQTLCVDSEKISDVKLLDFFNEGLGKILDTHAPLISKRISISKGSTPFDDIARQIRSDKRKLEKKWKISKDSMDLDNFRICQLILRDHLQSLADSRINEDITACGRDTKKLFKTVSHYLDLKKENPLPDAKCDETLAEEFSSFFLTKIEKIRSKLVGNQRYLPTGNRNPGFSDFEPVTEDLVLKIIRDSKAASCRSDPMPTSLVKQYSSILVPVITRIMNVSLASGTFFKQWKNALVIPLLKKTGLCLISNNYRPISNLPYMSKVAEKCALSQFNPYIEANQLLPVQQSAYRKYHSTETAVIKLTNDILWNFENQKVTSLIALDLSAAFDTVDHRVLISVLESNFGVCDSALSWFTSYLSGRSMQVQVNNTLSSHKSVEFSVPQGSVCGPVLFSCYSSTLCSVIDDTDTSISSYADDTEIHRAFDPKNLADELWNQEVLINTIGNIKAWMDQNILKLNVDKTEYIYFGSNHFLSRCHCDDIDLDGAHVSRASEIKFLGVWLDQNLRFQKHIVSKCQTAAMNIHYLRSLRKHLTIDSAKQIASCLVLSHLDYSNGVLIGLPDVLLDRMQRIQNWAAKVVLDQTKFSSSSEALKQLHWLPIRKRTEFKIVTLVFRCLHNTAPKYLTDLIKVRQFPRNTRSASTSEWSVILHAPDIKRATFASRAFSVAGPTLWNALPDDIRAISDYIVFRKHVKAHFFRNCFK